MVEEFDLNKFFKAYPWLVLGIILIFIFFHAIFQFFTPVFIPEPGKTVYISPGTKIKSITDLLEKEKIIGSSFYLRIYLFFFNKNVKAGFYNFKGQLNLINVAEILSKGGRGIRITFPEGLTLNEINDILNKKGIKVDIRRFKLGDFLENELLKYFPKDISLEGFLAPDTYEFFYEENEKEIIKKFLKNFSKKFLQEFLRHPEVNFYDKLILASMLEKEAKHKEDMQIISDILERRLKEDKKIEVDATIAYIKCKSYPCDWNIKPKDLKIKSPYNTYLNKGYPPTPISNPGLTAIKSALNPIKSDYWYYLTNKEGRAVFSKTFKEHQKNIKKYLK